MITRFQAWAVAILILGDFTAGTLWALRQPERVPVHWNFQGQVDRIGSPWEYAFIMPGVLLLLLTFLVAISFVGSVRKALARSGTIYGRIMLAIVGLMVVMHLWLMTATFDLQRMLVGVYVPLGLMLVALGSWMGKIRRNPLMGVRTPWTLKSDYVWDRTNLVGGRLMSALGALVAASAWMLPIWATVAVLLLGLVGLCIWAFVYSARLAKDEREGRVAPRTEAPSL